MEKFVKEILLSPEAIAQKVAQLGQKITADCCGEELVLICVLKGAMVFAADLMRQIDLPIILDTIVASSYGNSTESSGEVIIKQDIKTNIKDKQVLVVDDIVDTGYTLRLLCEKLRQRGPKSLKSCAFLDKPSRRVVDFVPDYVGYEIPDAFVIGYGLDYNEQYRALPYVGIVKEEYIQ